LFGIEKNITFDNLIKLNKSVSSDNEIKAKICGGNLTLIQNSIGTNWQINCENKFLFLEEINENPYKIDRLLLHLKQANIFKNCKAILLGDFLPDHKNDKLQKTLKMFSENINIPVFKIKDIGHGPSNYPLPFNYDAILNFKKASLSVKIH
jgi:muramoyltetrapeptide carboxypeptidase